MITKPTKLIVNDYPKLLTVTTKLLQIIGIFLPTLSPNYPATKLPIVIITNIKLA